MEWVKVKTAYETEDKAKKAASIVATTEARLASQPHGPQYNVEIRIQQDGGNWLLYWRKVFVGNQSGCGGGCGSCQEDKPSPGVKGKVIPFKRPIS